MVSNINASVPATGQATTQSVRDNFAAAKAEIEGLQAQTASLQSTADNLSRDDVSSAGADIASAPTIDLNAASGDLIDITGTAGIAAIALSEGRERTTRFTGSLTLTHGASLVLPGAADITTEAGDFAVWRGYVGGAVRCIDYQRAAQLPLYGDRAVAVTAPFTLPRSELTIAAGVIAPVRASHTVDTEADAASDDLDLIDASLTADGALLLLAAENGGRTVTVKHNSGTPTGNQLRIFLSDDADFVLDDAKKWLVLIRRGTAWQEIGRSRLELPAATTSVSGTVERATLPEIRDGTTDNKFGSSKDYYDSAAEVALTSSTNAVAWNMASGINFAIDTLAENTAISNPTNAVAGKSGYLRIVQDATGSRTVDWGSNFVFRGGEKPVATTVANAEDVFFYICLSAAKILIVPVLDAKAPV